MSCDSGIGFFAGMDYIEPLAKQQILSMPLGMALRGHSNSLDENKFGGFEQEANR